jgi:hypothetical protein
VATADGRDVAREPEPESIVVPRDIGHDGNPVPLPADLETARQSAEAISWTHTTYIRPHEYFLRKDHPEAYDLLHQAVTEHGYDAYFYRSPFRYLDLGEYKYWVYETLINCERLDLVHPTKAESAAYGALPGAESAH